MKRLKSSSALILIGLALLLSAAKRGGATPSNDPHASKIRHGHRYHHENPSPIPTLTYQIRTTPTPNQPASYTYTYYYPTQEGRSAFFSQLAAIISAILLTVFTGGLWWTSHRQWDVANRSLEQMHKATEATKANAEAAKQQAEIATRTLQATRAAVIDIDPIAVYIDDPTGVSTVYFEVHNSGRTKARIQEQNFHAWYHAIEQIWPVQQPFCHDGGIAPLPEILESHQTAHGHIKIDKPDFPVAGGQNAWVRYAVTGNVLLCLSGYVRYLDETEDGHETRICEAWNRSSKRFSTLPDMPRSYNRRS